MVLQTNVKFRLYKYFFFRDIKLLLIIIVRNIILINARSLEKDYVNVALN